jgi:MFS family permease
LKFRQFTGKQWTVLVILMLINFVNYVDRQIIFSLFPSIRAEFNLTYAQLGLFPFAFTVVLAVMSLPLGMLADRVSRKFVISAGVIFWSAATFFSGLAGSFHSLLAARGLVGVGEAAYTPAGTAVLSATFPKEVRARVQGSFDAGMFIGGGFGIALGGILAGWLGWRSAFFVVGIPGLILGLTGLKLPEAASAEPHARFPLRDLFHVPAYLMILLSGMFSSFAGYAYVTWGFTFVQEVRGFTPRESGIILGVTVTIAGALGILAGASLADRLVRIRAWGRSLIVPVGFFLASPLLYFALHSQSKVYFVILFGSGTFFLSWYHGPTTASIHDVIPSRGHATAQGFYSSFVNLFGMAVAPVVIGAIADRSGLFRALHAAVVAQLIGGALFLGVPYFIRRNGLHHPALAKYWEKEPPGVVSVYKQG